MAPLTSDLALVLGRIGLGCATFGREIDREAAFAVMDHALARGVTHFDTAAAYGGGQSERIVGDWLASRRPGPGRILVATKIKPPYRPEPIARSIEDSRGRLRVDAIDLLYLHQWSEELADEDALSALDQAVTTGLVRSLGASNLPLNQLEQVLERQDRRGFVRLRALQNNHNFAVRDTDPDLRDRCAREGVAVVTYSPLGAGFLTGKHKTGVEPGSRFDVVPGHQRVYFTDIAWRRLEQLEAASRRTGQSLPALSLTWIFHQPGIDCVLVGGRSPRHLDQALDALARGQSAWLKDLEVDPSAAG